MKKKIYLSALLIVILVMGLTACQTQKTGSNSKNNTNSTSAKSSTVSQNGKFKPAKEQIYASSSSNFEQAVDYPDIPSLVPASSAIIYGAVEDYDYKPVGSIIYTFIKVNVLESYMGNYQPGDSVTVIKYGGYVTLKNYFDGFTDPEERKSEMEFFECESMSEEELESYYIEQRTQGGIPVEIGKTSIFFLTPSALPDSREDEFVSVGNYQGEYGEVEPGIFYKPSLDSLEELKASLSGTEKENEEIIQSMLVTKDEIIAEIENSL